MAADEKQEIIIHCEHQKLIPIDEIKYHPRNPNKHSKEQIKRLAEIIEYQGVRHPVIVSNLTKFCIAGHGRLEALKLLGAETVPVDFQDFKDTDQEYAFMTSDNAIASWAELDLSLINSELENLGPDFDIDLLGLKDFVIEPADKEAIQDEIPEVPKIPRSKLGDIYEIGNHRVMCGDCTLKENVDKLMNGEKADILCWDPPWNLDFKYNSVNDNKTKDEYKEFLSKGIKNFLLNASNEYTCFVFQAEKNWLNFSLWFGEYEPRIFAVCKNFVQMCGKFFNIAWDPVLVWTTKNGAKNGAKNYFLSNTAATNNNPERIVSGSHPCPRQVDVIEWILSFCYDEQKNIMDITIGSGTTLIACEKTNRKCYGMEIDPQYVDVIVQRYVDYTGNNKIKLNGKELEWICAE